MSSEQPTATTVQETHSPEQLSQLQNHTSEMVKRLCDYISDEAVTSIDWRVIVDTIHARRTMNILLKANTPILADLESMNNQALGLLQHDWGNGHPAAEYIDPFLEEWYVAYDSILEQYR